MIDDTLEKRGQLHLLYNQPLRLVEKVKNREPGSTKAIRRDNSKVLPTQPSSSRPNTAHVLNRKGVKGNNSKVLPTQSSSARPNTVSNPQLKGVKRDSSKVLPTQLSSASPNTASDPHVLNRGVKRDNSKVLPTQPSSSRPQTASDPYFHIRERIRSSIVPSSSTSAKGQPTVTPAPRKRPSDTPDSAMKRQKTGKYPGCIICGGPHHLVKDCPITAEGPKRYFFLVSDFMRSLLITSWKVYALQSSDWSLNQGKLPLSLLSATF
jgi:hypothetical protein